MVSNAPESTINALPGLPSTVSTRSTANNLRDDSSIASGSSGFGSLTKNKKTGDENDPVSFVSSNITDSGISEPSEQLTGSITTDSSIGSANQLTIQPNSNAISAQNFTTQNNSATTEQGHSRNSSNTSQVSKIYLSSKCNCILPS